MSPHSTPSALIALIALIGTLAACISYPPAPPAKVLVGAERVRVQEMSEDGDAWLHEHCVFKGTMMSLGDAGARARAIEKGANFAEPMLVSTSSNESSTNGVVTSYQSSAMETFAAFYCPAFPSETVR